MPKSKLLLLILLIPLSFPNDLSAETGGRAEDFGLSDIDGKPYTLSELRGKVVLINFWATWCAECRVEMPSLNRLYERLKGEGLIVLGISINRSPSAVRDAIGKTPVSFPILLDPKGDVYRKYMIQGLPTSFLIDRQGNMAEKIIGGRQWDSEEFIGKVQKLLKEPPEGIP